ncbi:MAG: MFS transporter [Methylacidiphilales bacterium]|nr:MFS transporter [Candidatus Methylacidiphilales bacterium]
MYVTSSIKQYSWYAWFIAWFACGMMIVSNGMMITGLSIYDEMLIKEFGWTLSEYKFSNLISLTVAGLCAPFSGYIIDRFGTRVCILIGWTTLAIAYLFFSRIQSIQQLYFVHFLFGMTLTLVGLNVAVSICSSWANKNKRGMAVGIAIAGSSLGGIMFPFIERVLLMNLDWRATMFCIAFVPMLLFFVSLFTVFDNQLGKKQSTQAIEGIAYREAVRSVPFWALVIIACATFYSILGAQGHLFLYTRGVGFDIAKAANAVSLFFTFSLLGKFIFGYLADLFKMRLVFYANLSIMLLGGIFLTSLSPSLIYPGMICFGLGWGGVYTLIQYSVVSIFGLRDIGKIIGTITMLDAIAGGLGIFLSGVIKTAYNSYQPVFLVYVGMIIISLLSLWFVKPISRD